MPLKLIIRLVACALFALFSTVTLAQSSTADIRHSVEQFLVQQTQDVPGKSTITIGKVLENDRTTECKAWQAFLPAGARAWGRVTVGVRCLDGSKLSLFVSATVKIEGKYVVVMHAVSGGQLLAAADLELVDGELTALPVDIVTQMNAVVGSTARQALSARQPLRKVYLKNETAIQAGQTVKVISRGSSFTVTNEGHALNTAERGQLVRVRMENNQIVNGIARDAGVIEVVTQ